MKKIILLAIMLGLVGCGEKCGENGSSDVTSTTNNQSTELTSNSTQQAFARSISTYSMTVPFDGWHLFNPKALGASALYEGTKDALTSSAVLTADASQVAKVLGRGVAGYALSVAVEQLLGAVDWVMDPANNQIKYKIPASDPQTCSGFKDLSFNTKKNNWEYSYVKYIDYRGQYADIYHCFKLHSYQECSTSMITTQVITGTVDTEEQTIPLETVAQKVISNADAGSLDAQVATMAAAAQILEDAANDEEIEQEIVDDLEANANNCDPRKGENCQPECDPPAGVKFDKVTHYEKHGRNPDPNIGTHGCMAKTGSPVHWHYHVNNQLPDGRCIRGRYFGGCGEAP